MTSADRFSIDPSAVEAKLRDARVGGPSWRRRVTLGILELAVFFYAIIVVPPTLQSGDLRSLVTPTPSAAWRLLPFAIGVAAVMIFVQTLQYSRMTRRGPIVIARDMERDWARMTQRGWVFRVVLYGTAVGLLIGIPIGSFLAFNTPRPELPAGSQLLMIGVFAGATLLWTIPGAFLVRWSMLRQYRRLQAPTDGG